MSQEFVEPAALDDAHSLKYCQLCWKTFPERVLTIHAGQYVCPECHSNQHTEQAPEGVGSEATHYVNGDPILTQPEGEAQREAEEASGTSNTQSMEQLGRNDAGRDTTDKSVETNRDRDVDAPAINKAKRERRRDNDERNIQERGTR